MPKRSTRPVCPAFKRWNKTEQSRAIHDSHDSTQSNVAGSAFHVRSTFDNRVSRHFHAERTPSNADCAECSGSADGSSDHRCDYRGFDFHNCGRINCRIQRSCFGKSWHSIHCQVVTGTHDQRGDY